MVGKAFEWKADELNAGIRGFPAKFQRLIVATTEYHATRGETFMRTRAKWKDRTGNARNGLSTTTFHSITRHTIVFSHGVNYGIWLEVRWAGKYAIIMPAVNKTGIDVMKTLDKGFARLAR